MADKKLNEVTKVTDMAYVPVIMSDGSIGQIAKADLASVVAGLLPIVSVNNKGLVPKENYGIVSGFNSWVGNDTNHRIASIQTNYFVAIICVSQYNTEAKVFIVSVGKDKIPKATTISGSSSGITFSVSDGGLCISGAYDKNVVVILIKD